MSCSTLGNNTPKSFALSEALDGWRDFMKGSSNRSLETQEKLTKSYFETHRIKIKIVVDDGEIGVIFL